MAVKKRSAAVAAPFVLFPPRKHMGFAPQNPRKNRRNAPEISGKSIFGEVLQLR